MLVETDFKPEKESLLQIEVRLGNQPFFSTGRVAYSETLKTGQFASRIGLEFVKIDDENQVILENFVKKQIRK
ncbi:MAG: hypothetical protein CSA81_10760 [Acidobacteria bacterium]|nr:MAG: hypothetical protein CSA81_10760 [Acidobacteriota bacterium]